MQFHMRIGKIRVCDQPHFTVTEPLSCKMQLYFGAFFNLASPRTASREEGRSSPVHPAAAVVQPQDCIFMPVCNDRAWDTVTRHGKMCAHLKPRLLAAPVLQLPVPTVSRVLWGASKLKWMLWKISLTLQNALGS